MKYKDYSILTENDYKVISQKYSEAKTQENEDLNNILNKMQEQNDLLKSLNSKGEYSTAIDKLELNILELENIIKNNNVSSFSAPTVIPSFLKAKIKNIDNGAISPTRGCHEMRGRVQPLTPPTTSANPEILTPNTPQTPIAPQTQNKAFKRNRPMQGNIFFNLAQSLNLNKSYNKTHKTNSIDYNQKIHRNRFHNTEHIKDSFITSRNLYQDIEHYENYDLYKHFKTIPHSDDRYHHKDCHPSKKLQYSQIDIIRLILLYLTLNPNCRYCSRLSTLANDQFDILLDLLS